MSALASRYRPAPPPSDHATLTAQLVDGLCHDCRTPLAIIAEFASIVSEDLGEGAPSETLDFLWTIGERVREVEGLLSDYALVDRLLRRQPQRVDPIHVGALLADVQASIGPLARAFGKSIEWSGLDDPLEVPIRGGELLRAVALLIDNLYRVPGNPVQMRLWHAGVAEVGGTVVIECLAANIDPEQGTWSLANSEQMSFRQQLAATIAEHYGGRLELMDGAEHRASRLVLPAVEPEHRDLPPAA